MTQAKGFKNAPNITEFKKGMSCLGACGLPYYVYEVFGGRAFCGNWDLLDRDQIPRLDLDLDSIWVGRKFTSLDSEEVGEVVDVTANNVILTYGNNVAKYACSAVDFRRRSSLWPVVPVDPWSPEVGKECLWNELRVPVIAIHDDFAWIKLPHQKPTVDKNRVVATSELFPILEDVAPNKE